ncbi:hypothetical protein E4T39_05331 [Aureobasidium subglaciale]|nr:hypothetical protein E4T39_05331 [Aureobasidium subglaciale]
MAYTFPRREPFQPSELEFDMVAFMTEKLNITNPYRRYPPYGVPCPSDSNALHLSLRREKWWEMLEDLAWRERVMMQAHDAGQHKSSEKEEAESGEWIPFQQQKKERKDSLIPAEKDEVVDTKEVVVEVKGASAASTIHDSDDEDVPPEQTTGVKTKKQKTVVKEKEQGQKYEHQVRRVKPLSCIRAHTRKGSGASTSSTKRSASA